MVIDNVLQETVTASAAKQIQCNEEHAWVHQSFLRDALADCRRVPGPTQHRTVWRQLSRALPHRAKRGQPVAPGLAERTPGAAVRLDHRPGLRPPQPS